MYYTFERNCVEAGYNMNFCYDQIENIIEPLCSWYEENHRILPWRNSRTPYTIWISEIMLQQTRVETVKPYYYRFIENLPNVEALAQVDEDELLKLWEGLGYYSRARNLKKAANICVEQYEGNLPNSYEQLLKLPGIGSYTAGAIASIAYDVPVPAVDGNVLRVLSRVLAREEDIAKPKVKKKIEQMLQEVINIQIEMENSFDVSVFNQGLMELGAIVCIPNGTPLCNICPLKQFCLAYSMGKTDKIPLKVSKKQRRIEEKTVFLVHAEEKILLHKRVNKGLLAGMYEFPNVEGKLSIEEGKNYLIAIMDGKTEVEKVKLRGNAVHIFTHIQWDMVGYEIWLSNIVEIKEDWVWVTLENMKKQYSIPSAFRFMEI